MSYWFLIVPVLCFAIGCGPRPGPPTVQRSSDAAVRPQPRPTEAVVPDKKTGQNTARVAPTTSEISAARTAYSSNCSICHGPLETSSKRGVTLSRLTAAGVPMAVPLHTEVLREERWPVDYPDVTDDGIDTTVLAASALVEALK